jgi:hypothetical protein
MRTAALETLAFDLLLNLLKPSKREKLAVERENSMFWIKRGMAECSAMLFHYRSNTILLLSIPFKECVR